MRVPWTCGFGLALWLVALSGVARAQAPVVERAALVAALRAEQGYERRATTNQSRLQTRVLLRLAAARQATFAIDHEDWFRAYLEALGSSEAEAPLSVRLSHEHQYDVLVDARPGAVVASVRTGPNPTRALNVLWRSRRGTTRYSYRDPLAQPVLEMSFERTVSYRLLEFSDVVVLADIEGISGRPVTGALSLLFRLFGQARADWSRSALAADGWQVVVGQGRKGPFTRRATVTIAPDGRAGQGVPVGRADLVELERRLRQPLDVLYKPWRRE